MAYNANDKELVRVEVGSDFSLHLWLGSVIVRSWPDATYREVAEELAESMQAELAKEFRIRSANVWKEARYREVKRY